MATLVDVVKDGAKGAAIGAGVGGHVGAALGAVLGGALGAIGNVVTNPDCLPPKEAPASQPPPDAQRCSSLGLGLFSGDSIDVSN